MAIAERGLWCVVPAAGHGARFGGDVPKQHQMLGGKSLLMRTLERLAAQRQIAGLMVVLAPGDARFPVIDRIGDKPVATTPGGETRADSVLNGLNALRDRVGDRDFVLVHDAARPCVRGEDIARLIERASAAGGGLLAAPLRDTLKVAGRDDHVVSTESREMRWRALTPQMFRHGELVAALQAARAAGVVVTDEAMAMERAGHRPLLVAGAESNIKVTTPAELALAEFILASEGA
jgi:2-C-methyl-D-erythritol 4-phosphate cytidylyltransferase